MRSGSRALFVLCALGLGLLGRGISVATVDATANAGASSLARLKDGNARFASVDQPAEAPARPTAREHAPFAAVLSCADARVPPETIFHTAPGELFVVRAAGHVADRAILASIDYAAEQLQVPLLVVMGHESCDVVKGAMESGPAARGAIADYLFTAIRPSVERASGEPADTRLRGAILAHVEETINQILESSAVVRRRAESGQLTIAGAYYELTSGRVHFSEPVRVPPRLTTSRANPKAAPAPSAEPAKPVAAAATRSGTPAR